MDHCVKVTRRDALSGLTLATAGLMGASTAEAQRAIEPTLASVTGMALPATQYSTVSLLLADVVLSYSTGTGKVQVAAGAIIEAQGFRYQVLSPEAATQDLVSDGGVKLAVLRDSTDQYNVKAFGAVGDGIVDDYAAIQTALNHGGKVLAPSGTFLISQPLVIPEGCEFRGVGPQNTIIRKTAASTNIEGIDAVITCLNSTRRIVVEEMQVFGNRVDHVAGNTVTTHGFYFWGANHSVLRNLTARSCLKGFVWHTCWNIIAERLTAQTCQDYAFTTKNGCTSISFSNTLAWGCKGNFDISATVYFSIRDSACDLADAGGHPNDPFLPHGAGGNYQDPGYLFNIVGSRGTVISSGTENCYSRFLYAEGAFVDFINPYVYNLRCDRTTGPYYAFEVRGIGPSNINITNPLLDIVNGLPADSNRRMFFIETPRAQKIKFDRFATVDESFGDWRWPVAGVEFAYTRPIAFLTPSTMVAGEKSPLYAAPADITTDVVDVSGTRRLAIRNLTKSAKRLRIPIDNSGTLFLHLKGSHASRYAAMIVRVAADNGLTEDTFLSFSLTGSFDTRNYLQMDSFAALTAKPLYIEIVSPHFSDSSYFEVFRAELIL
ncbi:glycosyl hydrolase family 28-related protein [Mesorhizobium sp.]|uniref:glycosyl hydrolase family 28-related protein n=1 Tax=Mesorhizobium sp. TaxID=1871066 RepID=UPI000FE8D0DB|nr:glycosyl hydrolase family 28-related protein [Mesorhizobium sp.]RWP38388.1 MAG: hypothetical protein EOR03_02715 [Mesorhizobium sp.]